MAVQIQSRRSSTLNDRPFPIRLGAGELAVNNNAGSPGLFFADNTASPNTGLIKVGPVHVGSVLPNNVAAGFTGNSKGETWLNTNSTQIFEVYDGAAWQTVKAVVSISAGQPANPVNGQLHYDTNANQLIMYSQTAGNWINV
tara:strand:+ start:1713 stop:2138 length:426 start_codon:yes stop_codon:yes gene_type:complete